MAKWSEQQQHRHIQASASSSSSSSAALTLTTHKALSHDAMMWVTCEKEARGLVAVAVIFVFLDKLHTSLHSIKHLQEHGSRGGGGQDV